MHIVIAEEALQTGAGHWPSYIGGLAEAFRRAGDSVEVLVHKAAAPGLVERIGGTARFSRNCWLDPASQGVVGGLRHNFTFEKELKSSLVDREDPADWCLCLTMRLQHLLAMARLSRSRAISSRTRFLLLFVQGFGRYNGAGNPVSFPSSPSIKLARFCFRLMAPAVRAGRVVLAAETRGMQEELGLFTGLPVQLFPHPVPVPEPGGETSPESPVVLTAPGFARHEKGTDLLQEAVLRLLADPEFPPARFVLQWPEPFRMPDGSQLEPDRTLLDSERVDLVNENLDAAQYEQLLQESSLILLPYRRNSYHNRLSRVAIEAASRGKPLIFMTGTWSGELARLAGTGVPIGDETVDALEAAIRRAVRDLPGLSFAARAGASRVSAFHAGNTFREKLTEVVEK